MIGSRLGPYELLEELGHGGMATVYRAYQPTMDRYVAIKVIHKAIAIDHTSLDRFQREARLIARLEHPHILPVYDYDGTHDPPYIVMRYMPTGTLKEILERGRLTLTEAGFLIRQVASALDYAHRQNVIHRDVKPSNIMIDAEGNAFLTDFGIARMVEGTEGLTASGLAVGTPGYMAPEQGMGLRIDGRADIYALGVMLFEMVTGCMPYQAETPMGVILKHISDPVPLASAVNPELSTILDQIIQRAMAKDPETRYQSATEIADELLKTVGPGATSKHLQEMATETIAKIEQERLQLSGTVVRSPQPETKTQTDVSNRKRLFGGVTVMAVVVVLAGIFLALQWNNGKDNKGAKPPVLSCPALVQNAIDQAKDSCSAIGRNRVCYGSGHLTSAFNDSTINFEQPGNQVPLSELQSLQSSALNQSNSTLGIAIIQANVRAVVVGNVQITPIDDHLGSFSFSTGLTLLTACAEAPPPSLIIQAPAGASFTANGVTITAHSTVILQAQPTGQMTVSIVDGSAQVETLGSVQEVPAGYSTRITMNAALRAVSPPSPPERIQDVGGVVNLAGSSPLSLLAAPLDSAELATVVAQAPELTNTPSIPSDTPTPTNTATHTATPTETVTITPSPTDTPTETATHTATYTPIPTDTATSTATLTITPSPTSAPTETAAATSTTTPTEAPTNTPAATTPTSIPTPTTIPSPTPAPAGQMPYIQDMESGNALESWDYDPSRWQLVPESGNVILVGQSGLDSSMEILGRENPEWKDPTQNDLLLSLRVNLSDNNSIGRIIFRYSDQGYYVVEMLPGMAILKRGQPGPVNRNTEIPVRDWRQATIQSGQWYQVSIWSDGSRILVYIDQVLRLNGNDTGLLLPTNGAILLQTISAVSGRVGFDDITIQHPEAASEHFQGSSFPNTWEATNFTNAQLASEADGNLSIRMTNDVELSPVVPPLGDAIIACRLYSEVGGFTVRLRDSSQGAYVLIMDAGNMTVQHVNGQGDILQTWTRTNYYGRNNWFDFVVLTVGNRLSIYRQGEIAFEEEIQDAPPSGSIHFITTQNNTLRVDDCLFAATSLSATVDAQFAFDILTELDSRTIRDGLWDWYDFFSNARNTLVWWESNPGTYIQDANAPDHQDYYTMQSGGAPVFQRFRRDMDSTRHVFGNGEDRATYTDSTDIYVRAFVRLPLEAPVGSIAWIGARSVPSVTGASLNQYQIELIKTSDDVITVRAYTNTSDNKSVLYEQPIPRTRDGWHELIIVALDDRVAFFADGRFLAALRYADLLGGTMAIGVEANTIANFDDVVLRDTTVNY